MGQILNQILEVASAICGVCLHHGIPLSFLMIFMLLMLTINSIFSRKVLHPHNGKDICPSECVGASCRLPSLAMYRTQDVVNALAERTWVQRNMQSSLINSHISYKL